MTLLTTVFAAIIATVVWYKGAPQSEMKVGTLCWMYCGVLYPCSCGYVERFLSGSVGCSFWAHHLVGYSVIERSEGRCESGVVQEEISDMAERFCCNAGPLLSYLGFKRKRNELESSYFIHTSLIDFCVLKH